MKIVDRIKLFLFIHRFKLTFIIYIAFIIIFTIIFNIDEAKTPPDNIIVDNPRPIIVFLENPMMAHNPTYSWSEVMNLFNVVSEMINDFPFNHICLFTLYPRLTEQDILSHYPMEAHILTHEFIRHLQLENQLYHLLIDEGRLINCIQKYLYTAFENESDRIDLLEDIYRMVRAMNGLLFKMAENNLISTQVFIDKNNADILIDDTGFEEIFV